jgi:hypothetical protein
MEQPKARPARRAIALVAVIAYSLVASGVASPLGSLPVTAVTLFTNGVGLFTHEGTVEGNTTLSLPVALAGMDDLLQSLVVEDLGGGRIEAVRYGARDPLARVLASYAIDLSRDPSFAELLAQARGERVSVRAGAGEAFDATLVGVERVVHPSEGPRTFLTLLGDSGLRRLPLDEVDELRFGRAALQADLEAALTAIARDRGGEATAVTLLLSGEGERHVRFTYLREMPVWKTTYRLLLHDDGTADLQGWAIFDNPTDLDLVGVALTYVAGKPVSFVPQLFEPVYVARPRVAAPTSTGIAPPPSMADRPSLPAAPAPSAMRGVAAESVDQADAAPALGLLGAGVEAAADGARSGATVRYAVRHPVSVGRYESVLVPLVTARLSATPVALFDASAHARHPLYAFRLRNDTGALLPAGPLTVYQGGAFTGSALLPDLGEGDDRLVTYALDGEIEISRSSEREGERVTSLRLSRGVLVTEVRQRLRTVYELLPRPGVERFVVITHPRVAGFELVAPSEAPARTADGYRFGVALVGTAAPAPDSVVPTHRTCHDGEPCRLEVIVERVEERRVQAGGLSPDALVGLLEGVRVDDADRARLEAIVAAQRELAARERELAEERSRIDTITRDQERIRQNMTALERSSALYRRYVADLTAQEDDLVAVRARIVERTLERDEARTALGALLEAE